MDIKEIYEYILFASTVFMGFFAIMNPISSVTIFLALTTKKKKIICKKIAFESVVAAFFIVFIFAAIGHYILGLFGLSFTALRLAGAIIVGIIGYDMLQGEQSNVAEPSEETIKQTIKEDTSIAFAPLATPLLAGPGTIITAMNFSTNGPLNFLTTICCFGLLCIITYYCFIYAKIIQETIGTSTLKVITRMMGLILMVIGMQMLLQGIYAAIRDFT